jgi:hypothetical protein
MKHRFWAQVLVGLGIFGSGLATGLVARTLDPAIATDSRQRVEKQRVELSSGTENARTEKMEVITSVAEYKPGDRLDLHLHHGIEAAYVIQGATLQVPGKAPTALPTGATAMNLRNVRHGGFQVVGQTSLKLFTVHVVDQEKPLYDYTKPLTSR